jgi:hypothetical protein
MFISFTEFTLAIRHKLFPFRDLIEYVLKYKTIIFECWLYLRVKYYKKYNQMQTGIKRPLRHSLQKI